MPIRSILLLHHSHYDRGYMHPPDVEDALQADYLRQVIDFCGRHPAAKWTAEVTRPVRTLLDEADRRGETAEVEALALLAESGRFGVGALATHLTPLTDRRELEEAVADVARVREVLRAPVRTAFMHDINGLPWPVCDVLIDAGVELLVTGINEASYGVTAVGRHRLFHWVAPSGRRLRVYNADHYGAFNREMQPLDGSLDAMIEGWTRYEARVQREGSGLPFCFLTATTKRPSDCNPPDEGLPGLVDRWNQAKVGPPIRFVTGEDLLAAIAGLEARDIPSHAGDWTDWWNFGAASSPSHLAMARRARRVLRAVQVTSKTPAEPRIVGSLHRFRDAARLATEHLSLWNEHTFGCYRAAHAWSRAMGRADSEQKNGQANSALAWSHLAARLELERLAGNPPEGRGNNGCLVVNLEPRKAVVFPRAPREWLEPSETHNQAWTHHLNARLDYLDDGEWVRLPATVLPPHGHATLTLEAAAHDPRLSVSPDAISTERYRLGFDRETGSIEHLKDARNDRLLIDGDAARGWGEPRGESLADRRSMPRLDEPASSTLIDVDRDEITARVVRRHRLAAGHEVVSRIVLGAGQACVRVEWDVRLEDRSEPNALYAVFPTTLAPGWRAAYDTAGQRVRFDDEQLPGANRDFVTIDRFAEVRDDERCVSIYSPDAPLVMFGGFHFRQKRRVVARDAMPTLACWVYNNYWPTNFPITQPGRFRLGWTIGFEPIDRATLWTDQYLIHPICERDGSRRASG